MLIFVIIALTEVEFDLEFSCLLNDFIWKLIYQIFVENSVFLRVNIQLLDIKEHLKDDGPFRKLLDAQIEDVLA